MSHLKWLPCFKMSYLFSKERIESHPMQCVIIIMINKQIIMEYSDINLYEKAIIRITTGILMYESIMMEILRRF